MYEIERKYLINYEKWNPVTKGVKMIQGYLSNDAERIVRVRIAGEKAFLTIKGKTQGIKRVELEYEISLTDATEMLKMCVDCPVEKVRYKEKYLGKLWEIDIFGGKNKGLFMAEVELEDENENVELPDWIIKEVSHDERFFNAYLSKYPYSRWTKRGY